MIHATGSIYFSICLYPRPVSQLVRQALGRDIEPSVDAAVAVRAEMSAADTRSFEVLTAAVLACRQMVNIGSGSASERLAHLIHELPGKLVKLRGSGALEPLIAFSPDVSAELLQLMGRGRLVSGEGESLSVRQFNGHLAIEDQGLRFAMKPTGFGFLGRRMNHYATISVFALVLHMVSSRPTDDQFLEQLQTTLSLCADDRLSGALSIRNQNERALAASRQAFDLFKSPAQS